MSDAIIEVGGETITVTLGGDNGLPIPSTAGNAGKFLVAGVGGDLQWASGTGNDPDLRTDLAASDGVDLVDGVLLRTAAGLDAAALEALAAAAGPGGVIPADKEVDLGSSGPIDDHGATFVGTAPIRYEDADADNEMVQNLPRTFPHYGLEYLYQFHRKLYSAEAVSIAGVGDSNEAGGVGLYLQGVLEDLPELTFTQYGAGGSTVRDFLNGLNPSGKNIDDVKGAGHDCILFEYAATNDPAEGLTIDDFEADLDAAIASLRSVYPVGSCSIVMFTGTPIAGNTVEANGRKQDQVWNMEARNRVLKVARKYRCAVLDKMALYPDSNVDRYAGTDSEGTMLDVLGLHTQPPATAILAEQLLDMLVPPGIIGDRLWYTARPRAASVVPSAYRTGRSCFLANASDGWPFDGYVYTDKPPYSNNPQQELRQYGVDYPIHAVRCAKPGVGDVWGEWQYTSLRLKRILGYDPPSLAAGARATTTVSMTGVALGDTVQCAYSFDLQGIELSAWVSSAGVISILFVNGTSGTIDLASGAVNITVEKALP